MRTIRRGVFETNSSSMHSITINGKDNLSKCIGTDGVIKLSCGEYGWKGDTLDSVFDKLEYLMTYIGRFNSCNTIEEITNTRHFKLLAEMIKEYSGETIELYDDGCGVGYIDHQSSDLLEEDGLWVKDETQWKFNMLDFIYNSKYSVEIDNDNH